MNEVTLGIFGLIMIYTVIHYITISFSKTWKEHSGYEHYNNYWNNSYYFNFS